MSELIEISKFVGGGLVGALIPIVIQLLKNKPEQAKVQDSAIKTLIEGLTARVSDLETDVKLLHVENKSLREERIILEEEVRGLKKEIDEKGNYITTLKAYYEHMPSPAWMKDQNGVMTFINGAYERTFGVTKLEYEGRRDEDVWGEEVAKEFGKHDAKIIAKRKALRLIEHVPQKNGDVEEWIIWKFPIEHNGELLIGGVAVAPKKEFV